MFLPNGLFWLHWRHKWVTDDNSTSLIKCIPWTLCRVLERWWGAGHCPSYRNRTSPGHTFPGHSSCDEHVFLQGTCGLMERILTASHLSHTPENQACKTCLELHRENPRRCLVMGVKWQDQAHMPCLSVLKTSTRKQCRKRIKLSSHLYACNRSFAPWIKCKV